MYTIKINDNHFKKKSLMGVYSVIRQYVTNVGSWEDFEGWANLNLAIFNKFTINTLRYDITVRSES